MITSQKAKKAQGDVQAKIAQMMKETVAKSSLNPNYVSSDPWSSHYGTLLNNQTPAGQVHNTQSNTGLGFATSNPTLDRQRNAGHFDPEKGTTTWFNQGKKRVVQTDLPRGIVPQKSSFSSYSAEYGQTPQGSGFGDLEALRKQQEELIKQKHALDRANINKKYDDLVAQTKARQAQDLGETNLAMARMGAYSSGAGVAYGNSLRNKYNDEINELEQERQNSLSQAQWYATSEDLKSAWNYYNHAQELQDKIQERRLKHLQEVKQLNELQKYEKDNAMDTINSLVKAGYNVGDIPKDYLNALDSQAGMPEGFSEQLFSVNQASQKAKELDKELDLLLKKQKINKGNLDLQKGEVDLQKSAFEINKLQNEAKMLAFDNIQKITKTLKELPAGTAIKVGDTTYYGTQGNEVVEHGPDGYGRMIITDPFTGKKMVRELGFIGKVDKDGNNPAITQFINGQEGLFNRNTGTWTYIGADATSTDRFERFYPTGSYHSRNGVINKKTTQCGAFVNDLTGIGFGDSLESKLKKRDLKLGTEEKPLRVGDVIITDEGGRQYGHVAIINNITKLPNGKLQYTLTESNYHKKNGLGVVENTRKITEDNPHILGYARGRLPEFLTKENFAEKVRSFEGAKPAVNQFMSKSEIAKAIKEADTVNNYAKALLNGGLSNEIPTTYRAKAMEIAKKNGWDDKRDKLMKLPSTERKSIIELIRLQKQIDRLKELKGTNTGWFKGKGVNTGWFADKVADMQGFFNLEAGSELRDFKQIAKNLQAWVQHEISGAAVSEPEVRRLEQFIPKSTDEDKVVMQKLKNLQDKYNDALDATARLNGFKNREELLKAMGY